MSIDRIGGSRGFDRPERPDGKTGSAGAERTSRDGADRVELSREARRISDLAGLTEEFADVRPERVARAREQLESSTYRPDLKQIAHAIVEFEDDLGR